MISFANNNSESWILLYLTRGAETRKAILSVLLYRPKNCNQIAKETKLNWRTVQGHLEKLLQAKLLNIVKIGHMRFYKISPKGREVLALLNQNKK